MSLRIVPITFKAACAFIAQHHRHHKPPRGMKFCLGVALGETLVGVVTAGRPVARECDDGLTLEINRTCTDGTRNANSMLYGAARRVGVAMGYTKILTYLEEGETGATMRAVGFRLEEELEPRGSWSEHSLALKAIRDSVGTGGRARQRWVWP